MLITALLQVSLVHAACPARLFMTPADADSDPRLPAPKVTAHCESRYLVVESNGVPGYDPAGLTPNDMRSQDHTFRIPLYPRRAAVPDEVPYLGPLGVTVTGLPIYAPNEASDLDYGDAKLDGIVDACGGHVGPDGGYHFHGRVACPFDRAEYLATAVIGYAFDGNPIMAPWLCEDRQCTSLRKIRGSWHECLDEDCTLVEVEEAESSWVLKKPSVQAAWEKFGYVEGSGDLDKCNGMMGPDGQYRYYSTEGFPYSVGCYRGEVDRRLNNLQVGWSERDPSREGNLFGKEGKGPPDGAGPDRDGPPDRGGPDRGGPDRGGPPDHPDKPPKKDGKKPPPKKLEYLGGVADRLGVALEDLLEALAPLDAGGSVETRALADELGVTERQLRAAFHGHD